MKKIVVVFGAVKDCSKEAGPPDEKSLEALACINTPRKFFPLNLYLDVLQSTGLIRYRAGGKEREIELTEKGRNTETYSLYSIRFGILLYLFLLRHAVLFLLFMPLFLVMQKPYSPLEERNSAG